MVEAGGVKLDEFHVSNRCPCPVGHCHAVAGRYVGITRVKVNLSRSTGCEKSGIGCERVDIPRRVIEHIGADTFVCFVTVE